MYRASKATATNLARSLAVHLVRQNFAVGVYHPGWVRTDMGGQQAALTPSDSAVSLLQSSAALSLTNSGVFEDYTGVAIPIAPGIL